MSETDVCFGSHCVLCTLRFQTEEPIFFLSSEDPRFQQGIYYPCVVSNCQHPDGLVLACHSTCAREGQPSLAICEVTRWDRGFKLPIAQSAERERHLKNNYTSTLDIARSTLQVKERITRASRKEVRTSSGIWATYVTLHGETYVSTLSNSCGQSPIYSPRPTSTEDVIYVRRGPFGVKKVIFACSTETLEMESLPWDWWQALPLTEDCVLHFDTDGLKLRNLQTAEDVDIPLWSAPFFRQDLARLPLVRSFLPARFNRILVNDPETTGYSVAWNAARRAFKIARHTAWDYSSCYADISKDETTWLHIPLSRGELLHEFWCRKSIAVNGREMVDLILVTTTGRVHVLGKYPTPGQTYTYSHITTFPKEPDYLYIDDSAGIREVAFVPAPILHERSLSLPEPKSFCPKHTSVESYFYTFASLENLSFIKICKLNGMIIGLLLHYHNGLRASVGQVRLDQLSKEQQVPDNATIRFVISRTEYQCPYVSSVLVLTEGTAEGPPTILDLEVACYGTLEWWFSRRQCQLAYEGRTSAPTRF
ncbi:hypothetical protein V8C42DRAFT_337215 [Trichoderma barbatum]